MEEKVIFGVIFLHFAKEIWDTLKEVHNDEKNIFRFFELYEPFFLSQAREMFVPISYSALCGILDNLEVH